MLEFQKEMYALHSQFNDYFQVMEDNSERETMETILNHYTIIGYVFEPLKVMAYVQNFHFTKSEKKLLDNYKKNKIKNEIESLKLEKKIFSEKKSYLSKEVMKENLDEAIIIIDKTIAELKR